MLLCTINHKITAALSLKPAVCTSHTEVTVAPLPPLPEILRGSLGPASPEPLLMKHL